LRRPREKNPGPSGKEHHWLGEDVKAGQRAIKGATAKVLDQCGHMPEIEKPEEFVRVVLDFMAERT
jgi:pimeloyl-ACP methyl ester carboxylesterase